MMGGRALVVHAHEAVKIGAVLVPPQGLQGPQDSLRHASCLARDEGGGRAGHHHGVFGASCACADGPDDDGLAGL